MIKTDVIIIGAGVIGLSIAYHLACSNNNLKITVLEKEQLPGMGSTAQCTGGIRHQFTSRLNIQLTKLSWPYFKKFNTRMGIPIFFRQKGYLLCASTEERINEFQLIINNLEEAGIPVTFLEPEEVKGHYPHINTSDLRGATFCPRDAYADPGNVVQGYARQASRLGVQTRLNETVEEILLEGNKAVGVKTSQEEYRAPVIVNAAGPGFTRLAGQAGVSIPARPFRRQVYVCSPLEEIPGNSPLTVDMDTGFYLHTEKNGILLLGGTDQDTAPGESTAVDWSLLDNFIETAVNRIPCLENAELTRAYTGIRSLTPDHYGILGESKQLRGFFLAGGFGGQGFMHAPALGMIAAELITRGDSQLVDTSQLSPDRFDNSSGSSETVVF